jgi:hypothetical protein
MPERRLSYHDNQLRFHRSTPPRVYDRQAKVLWRNPINGIAGCCARGGPAPRIPASALPQGKLTIRVAINRNAEALHDAANLAK